MIRELTMNKRSLTLSLAIVFLTAGTTLADAIFLTRSATDRTPQDSALTDDAQIIRIEKDALVFRNAGGNETSRPLDRIAYVQVTNDAALSAGETAFIGRDWNKAIDSYVRVARSTSDWRARWVGPRLIDAANNAKRFDAAIVGYLALARTDPQLAAARKPALPAKGSQFLEDAVKELETAYRSLTTDAQRQAVLALQLDIHTARGDANAVAATLDQLLKLAGPDASANPANRTMLAGVRLSQARQALQTGDAAKAVQTIRANEALFVDVLQQAEAMFILAEAAGATATSPDAKQDAALAFLRVSAHFSDVEGKPYVADSLVKAAALQEQVGDIAGARKLFEQIVAEFPQSPQAASAADALKRLAD
jgi:TolA-binding protein